MALPLVSMYSCQLLTLATTESYLGDGGFLGGQGSSHVAIRVRRHGDPGAAPARICCAVPGLPPSESSSSGSPPIHFSIWLGYIITSCSLFRVYVHSSPHPKRARRSVSSPCRLLRSVRCSSLHDTQEACRAGADEPSCGRAERLCEMLDCAKGFRSFSSVGGLVAGRVGGWMRRGGVPQEPKTTTFRQRCQSG